MNLLDKFDTVTVVADHRIADADKVFCETHQAAYRSAIQSFQELLFFWQDTEKTQQELLGEADSTAANYQRYLTGSGSLSISEEAIRDHIRSLHTVFIQAVVHHFNRTYHISVSIEEIQRRLLPQEPDENRLRSNDAYQAYLEAMLTYRAQYQDVVDQILLLLDGRCFTEQAFYELTGACHKAAWNLSQNEPRFERKKNVIRFTGYMCKLVDTWRQDEWELESPMKQIMRGLAHYETGAYEMYPLGFSELIGYSRILNPEQEFPTCEKVKSLKMFKNHRVDVKFSDASCAQEFIDRYLGAVC